MSLFTDAVRMERRARIALQGPAGSGKTFTALRIASALAGDDRFVVIDSENGAASLYAGRDNPDGGAFSFGTLSVQALQGPTGHHPTKYLRAIQAASDEGHPVLVVDGMSSMWAGAGGMRELAQQGNSRDGRLNWAKITPFYNAVIEALTAFPGHLIVTLRTKKNAETGEIVTVQRGSFEYEMDLVLQMAPGGLATVEKTRCEFVQPEERIERPGAAFATRIQQWLGQAATTADWADDLARGGLTPSELDALCAQRGWSLLPQWPSARREGLLNACLKGTARQVLGLDEQEFEPAQPEIVTTPDC